MCSILVISVTGSTLGFLQRALLDRRIGNGQRRLLRGVGVVADGLQVLLVIEFNQRDLAQLGEALAVIGAGGHETIGRDVDLRRGGRDNNGHARPRPALAGRTG